MLKLRILTSLVLAPLTILLVLFVHSELFAIFIAALCLLAVWEWTRLIGYRQQALSLLVMTGNALLLVLLWRYHSTLAWRLSIVIGNLWWWLALAWLRHYSFAAAPTRENQYLKLLVGSLMVIPAWTALIDLHLQPIHGPAWALFALILVWCADSAAYFVGSRWGTTKLAPRISPGKTVVGVYGAFGASAVLALIGGWWLGLRDGSLFAFIGLSLITVTFSIIGDLFESLIKRHSNVKDSGAIFPGHGGLFDRLDSTFAALPIFALGKILLGL